jgi:phosphoenolpyruvate synthase/pyruvate phosphate dikinase
MSSVMEKKYIFPIKKDFDYFDVENFRTKKLEGTVELRNAGLPGADAYLVSPKLYINFKKNGELPQEIDKELDIVTDKLIKDFSSVTVRTCFRFSGYENPRSLPAFRQLTSLSQVKKGIIDAYKAGEDFAKDNGIDWFELGLIIMGRVNADKSGIIMVDPEESDLCVVEVCWGDVHLIAVGEDDFDSYWVNSKGKIVERIVRDKKVAYYFEKGERGKKDIEKSKREMQLLDDKKAIELAKYAFEAAKYHKSSAEIEYMIRDDGFVDMYELQEQPGLHLKLPKDEKKDKDALVSGTVVNEGKVDGKVKIVKKLDELNEVQPGAVLVLPSKLMGEDIPILGKVKALITDTGGITAHISTVAKECGIPAIVGTGNASEVLEDGMRVIVDANKGRVYSFDKKQVKQLGSSGSVVWLEGIKAEMDLVGAKAFNLVALMQIGANVPNAYVVTTDAFSKFVKKNGIKDDIEKLYSKDIDVEELGKAEELLRDKILSGKLDKDIEKQILSSFSKLKKEYGAVSVRSSATCEDSLKASFAGQFQSFLFIDDKKTLVDSVKRCWASLFRAGAILYAIKHGVDIKNVKMGVIVQGMIDADAAGVMFTKDLAGKENVMLIESAEGVGENVVSGEVTPITYTVRKDTGRIMSKDGKGDDMLSSSQVTNLASLGKKVEESFGLACDIEWALKDDKIFVLQSRPITT